MDFAVDDGISPALGRAMRNPLQQYWRWRSGGAGFQSCYMVVPFVTAPPLRTPPRPASGCFVLQPLSSALHSPTTYQMAAQSASAMATMRTAWDRFALCAMLRGA
jgi:hypothetical protein